MTRRYPRLISDQSAEAYLVAQWMLDETERLATLISFGIYTEETAKQEWGGLASLKMQAATERKGGTWNISPHRLAEREIDDAMMRREALAQTTLNTMIEAASLHLRQHQRDLHGAAELAANILREANPPLPPAMLHSAMRIAQWKLRQQKRA